MRQFRHHQVTRRLARAALAGWALCVVAGVLLPALYASPPRRPMVYALQMEGVINPLSARYLARGLARAEHDRAAALVFEIDTPGGLDSSMRRMVEDILSADVPVIVYVAPAGARAASAGMFVTIAGHIAAMAPGTTIGAAHPVTLGEGDRDETTVTKMEEDAAAYARSVATLRGHNPEWAERAVRESVSVTAEEALEAGTVDVIARSRAELLNKIDGRVVEIPSGEVTLRTAAAVVHEMPMTLLERLLHLIADPNIAYILLTIGMIGLIAEMYHPGALYPGITGAICMLLGLTALGMLPTGWAGVALLLLAMGLFIAEVFAEGFGVLGAGAAVSFILGSLLLFVPVSPVSPAAPAVRVSPWLVAVMSAILVGMIVLLFRVRMAMWRKPPAFGAEAMVGREGVALSKLDPFGTIRLDSEVWRAEARPSPIKRGDRVRVVKLEGVTLVVERAIDAQEGQRQQLPGESAGEGSRDG